MIETATEASTSTAIESCYRKLKQDIIAGIRSPEEKLRISRLAEIYKYGPGAIREALQRLTSDGLVDAFERRGFAVARLDAKDFEDLNFARIEVETSALRLSIAAGDDDWEAALIASAYQLERADKRLVAGELGDHDDWESKNTRFHRDLLSACPSNTLLRMCEQLNEHVERYRRASVARSLRNRDIVAEHRAIAKAALERDEDAAVEALKQHYQLTVTMFGSDG